MKVFILIMSIISNGNDAATITTAEFSSLQNCQSAGFAFGRAFSDTNNSFWLKAFHLCVEK